MQSSTSCSLKDLKFTTKGLFTPSRFGSLEIYKIWRFSTIGTSTAAQRYRIAKNGSTSSGHRQNIGEKNSNGRQRYKVLNKLKNLGARCSSMVTAFAHGAMGRRINPSWRGPIELFIFQPVLHDWCNKGRVCAILSLGWCI